MSAALLEAERIVGSAHAKAEEIAGEAYGAVGRLKELTEAAAAIKNKIEGYGDSYIIPTYHLLDDLAEEIGYTEAGQKLKDARELSKLMVKNGQVAVCDYAEANRRATAIRFVTDAFNGKVDSILSRAKSDNHGTLEKEIRDSFALVNVNGASFRNARVTEAYLQARLEELRWAATAAYFCARPVCLKRCLAQSARAAVKVTGQTLDCSVGDQRLLNINTPNLLHQSPVALPSQGRRPVRELTC